MLAVALPPLGVCAAESYPARPLRLITPFSPGGGADVVGRVPATKLTERLGKQLIAANRSGAGGAIGTDLAARSAPDGHTLVFVLASFTMQPEPRRIRVESGVRPRLSHGESKLTTGRGQRTGNEASRYWENTFSSQRIVVAQKTWSLPISAGKRGLTPITPITENVV